MSNTDSDTTRWADLRAIDVSILNQLDDGRCTPRYLSKELDRQQSYVSQRLTWMLEQDMIERLDRGLYELDVNLDAAPVVICDE